MWIVWGFFCRNMLMSRELSPRAEHSFESTDRKILDLFQNMATKRPENPCTSSSGFVNDNHLSKWNKLMQIRRENDSPDLGCPLLGSSVLVCVQLHSHLCSIQKAEGFKCEAIPYSSYFYLLDIDLLLYWWVTIAKWRLHWSVHPVVLQTSGVWHCPTAPFLHGVLCPGAAFCSSAGREHCTHCQVLLLRRNFGFSAIP